MQAVILAGGKGTRLLPYTTILPKPLMPVGELPIMEILLRQLKAHGVGTVFLAVGYLRHLIESYFQDGSRIGINIKYSVEEEPLGTAGPVAALLSQLPDDFMILNGDLLTTLNFKKLFEFHKSQKAGATIATFPREQKVDFGVLEIVDQKLVAYQEKPIYNFSVSMGINVLNKKAVSQFLKPNEYLDIPDLMMKLAESQNGSVACYQEECLWLDIGRVDDYKSALGIFESHRDQFLPG